VFGITDNFDLAYHLQSYWLYFPPATLPVLIDFFTQLGTISDREDAIHKGELGLSRYLLERGVKLTALSPVIDLIARLGWWFRLRLFAELTVRKLQKGYKYSPATDVLLLNYLRRRGTTVPLFDQTLPTGTELYRRGLSPFVKRRFIEEGYFFRYGVCGYFETSATLSNDEVRSLLAPKLRLRRRA
jgi:hypothetical protein